MSKKAEDSFAKLIGLFHVRQMRGLVEYHEFTSHDGDVEFLRLRQRRGLIESACDDKGWDVYCGNQLSQASVTEGCTCPDVPCRVGRLDHLTDLSYHLGMSLTESLAEKACEDSIAYCSHAARSHRVNARIPYLCCTDTCSGIREHPLW